MYVPAFMILLGASLPAVTAQTPTEYPLTADLASLYATQGRRAEAARIESALAPPRAMLSPGFTVPPAPEP